MEIGTIYGPPTIETPELGEHVQLYFCSEIKNLDEVAKIIRTKEDNVRGKLSVVTERFEFICHLMSIRQLLADAKTPPTPKDYTFQPLGDGKFLGQRREHIQFHGKEYDGADYDIDALCFYLLLTCIENIAVDNADPNNYVTLDEWLIKNWDKLCQHENSPKECIKTGAERHREECGLRRHFKKALVDNISPELQERLITHFAVSKLQDGELDKDSWSKWEKMPKEKKLKTIAEFLYDEVRSKYTHAGHRTFFPSTSIRHLPASKQPALLALVAHPQGSLLSLLQDIVVYLVRKELLGLENESSNAR